MRAKVLSERDRKQNVGAVSAQFPWETAHVSTFDSLPVICTCRFPGGSVVESPPAVQETLVRSLGWEDPLETA